MRRCHLQSLRKNKIESSPLFIMKNYEKTKDKMKYSKPDLGCESQLRVKKVLVPNNVRLKMIPLIN